MANGSRSIVLPKLLGGKIESIIEEKRGERKKDIQKLERLAEEREAKMRNLENRQLRYARLARKGFVAITRFARSATMRDYFHIKGEMNGSRAEWVWDGFVFFQHQYVSIGLFPDKMLITILHRGSRDAEKMVFPYDSVEYNEWVSRQSMRLAGLRIVNFAMGFRENRNRDHIVVRELWREEFAFSVLVNCANPRRFKGLLANALQKNR
ncbi:MAG: hypothetical protein NUV61_02595 [Candidatus Azambacteria bacterium]|nr:hypothetical protein [Candidatus Azambacteria bacterium]